MNLKKSLDGAILQFNKNNIGLLNERQKDSLASIGFIGY